MLVGNLKNHYETLAVSRDAPPEVIRAAYKALSQKWHPDKNKTSQAHGMMQRLNVAHDVLSDPFRRAQYDFELNKSKPSRANSGYTRAPRPSHEMSRPATQYKGQPPRRGAAFTIDETKLKTAIARLPRNETSWLIKLMFPLLWPVDTWLRKRLK